jgi:hypothetical protein
MLNSFIINHLPTAKKHEELSKSIITYSGDDKIFVIGLGSISGIITEQKKAKILKQIKRTQREVYFFTLFNNKEDFQKLIDKISWGSYVWIATEPEHTIHFDDKPKLKARHYQ